MAEQVLLPQQGNSVESCILLQWRKQVGEAVTLGEVICEVETDKASFEVESTAAGVMLAHHAAEGDEVAVMAPLCSVGQDGEQIAAQAAATPAPKPEQAAAVPEPAVEQAQSTPVATPGPSRPPAVASASQAAAAHPAAASNGAGNAIPSPRAALRAEELGVSLQGIAGSGPGGRVIERDVVAAANGLQPVQATAAAAASHSSDADAPHQVPAAPTDPSSPPAAQTELPLRGIRKVIAARMLASLQQTAQFTLHAYADARALIAFRARLKTHGESLGMERVSINDLVMVACARTLPDYPALNAHLLEDRIVQFGGVDMGFAVDTERGLLVPTIRAADRLSVGQLGRAARELATRAAAGKASSEDLAEATFTCSNLGASGVQGFTPVLNPPQVAILGIGGIELRAVTDRYDEHGEAQEVRHVPHIALSLTIDHRAVDGAPAARFLAELCRRIAAIDLALAR